MPDLEDRLLRDARNWRASIDLTDATDLGTSLSSPRTRRWLLPALAAAAVIAIALTVGAFAVRNPERHRTLATAPTTSAVPTVSAVPAESVPAGSLTARIVLAQVVAKPGDEIQATVFLTNHTATPIATENTTCAGFVQAALASAQTPAFAPMWLAVGCSPGLVIGLGTTTVTVTIQTTFDRCIQGPAEGGYPQCGTAPGGGPYGLPVLPAGTYHTEVAFNLPPGLVSPIPTIQVTLIG